MYAIVIAIIVRLIIYSRQKMNVLYNSPSIRFNSIPVHVISENFSFEVRHWDDDDEYSRVLWGKRC